MATITDKDANAKVCSLLDQQATLVVNPISSKFLCIPGYWKLTFSKDGWGFISPVSGAAPGSKPLWLKHALKKSAVVKNSEGEIIMFTNEGKSMKRVESEKNFDHKYYQMAVQTHDDEELKSVKCYEREAVVDGQLLWWTLRDLQVQHLAAT